MRALVPVKEVARLGDDAVLQAGVRPEGDDLEWRRNDWDAFSLEAAVKVVEAAGEGEVVAASVGGEASEDGLRAYLAAGADRALRVWGPALASPAPGLDPDDPLVVSAVLAAVARRVQPDLITCGAQSADAAHAATGIALAGVLDLPHAAVAASIELDDGLLTVAREIEGGAIEVLRLTLPALVTVQTGAKKPRQPNFRAIREARSKPLEVWSLEELGVDAATLAAAAGYHVAKLAAREDPAVELLAGPLPAIAERIAAIVASALRT